LVTEKEAILFTDEKRLTEDARIALKDHVQLKPYDTVLFYRNYY
jgi:fibrillarin-like rRNA methylase